MATEMDAMALGLCLFPLGIIFVLLKMTLLISNSQRELNHIHDESKRPHEYMDGTYDDIDREKEADRDW